MSDLLRQQAHQVMQHELGKYAKEHGLGKNRWQYLVHMFHIFYKQPWATQPHHFASLKTLKLRFDLINEECSEFNEAVSVYTDASLLGDKVVMQEAFIEMVDALGDMIVVILGTAVSMGVDMNPVMEEIMLSNFSKAGDDGQPIFREDGKVMKGPNYFKVDLAKVLGEIKG